jgi:porin
MSGWRIAPLLRAGFIAVAATLAWPELARAECGLSEASLMHGATGIPEGAIASIDPGGVRRALGQHGIELGGYYVGDGFGNSGGIQQGVKYDGVLDLYLNADLHQAGLWKGLCFHTDAFQIHGQSITADNIGSLMPVSSYEATPATRLFELWLEQHMFNDRLSIRFGQLAADAEFIIAEGGGYLLNGTWGWPTLAAADMPGGGPAYPLATPGVRVALTPNDKISLLVGAFNGDPADPNCTGDPQICNNDGLDFRLDSPPLLLIEGAYKYDLGSQLPGTVKLGGWNHFGTFEHQRFEPGGLLIGVTLNPGRPVDGDWGLYGIIDQLVWRVPGSQEAKGLGVFGRVIGAPSAQNLVDIYADGGVTFSGMIPHRPDDSFAVGFAYTGISQDAHGFDLDSGLPVARSYEALLEICYTLQLKSGWTLQPDFQYFWQPGGGVPNASGHGTVGNAAVWGARTTLNF